MKKVVSLWILAALLVTLAVAPAPALAEGSAGPRDDYVILFDGWYNDIDLQFSAANPVKKTADTEIYLEGNQSTRFEMGNYADTGFPQENFCLMCIIHLMDLADAAEYPISELSFYNHTATKNGDSIQINYVDPDNSYGAPNDLHHGTDDSFNKDFEFSNQPAGWHRLSHVVTESKLPGWNCNPSNIDHIRISWRTDKNNYTRVDWNFDCLLLAKQSFFDDRSAAETEVENLVATLTVPTAETYDELKEPIETAIAKYNAYKAEFPNYMIDNLEKLNQVTAAFMEIQGPAAAAGIVQAIDALGDITADNAAEKEQAIRAIDADLAAYTKAGYPLSLITNIDKLTAARDQVVVVQVVAQIEALPDEITENDAMRVYAARAAFNDLSPIQQNAVPAATVQKLQAAVEAVQALLAVGTYGDLNGDEKVDAGDALLVLKAAVGKTELTDAQKELADVNGDNAIDAKDALLILKKAVGKIDKFPVEE